VVDVIKTTVNKLFMDTESYLLFNFHNQALTNDYVSGIISGCGVIYNYVLDSS